ncbi:hypothetical protein ID866_9283 [Astraeus odoratus]|nr:hypothetical protein ID866_9283 [Astraeus odoratus]
MFLCITSTHEVTYSISTRFAITNWSGLNPIADAYGPTVAISRSRDPLKVFATTFGSAAHLSGPRR